MRLLIRTHNTGEEGRGHNGSDSEYILEEEVGYITEYDPYHNTTDEE